LAKKLPADQMRRAFAAARRVGERIENASAAVWREELTGVRDKVTLGIGWMRVQISRNGLMDKLGVTTGSLDNRNEFWAF
jgi:hypothetical protein